MLIILLVILLVLALGSYPSWPYSRNWGYYPSGGLGLVLLATAERSADSCLDHPVRNSGLTKAIQTGQHRSGGDRIGRQPFWIGVGI